MTYLIVAFFVYGLHKVIWETAGFFQVDLDHFYTYEPEGIVMDHYYHRPTWQKAIMKPLFYCAVCMSSVWGTFAYFVLLGETNIAQWILHCVISAAIVYILTYFTSND